MSSPARRNAAIATIGVLAAGVLGAVVLAYRRQHTRTSGAAPPTTPAAAAAKRPAVAVSKDTVLPNEERQRALELLQALKLQANTAFQRGRFEEALSGYQNCMEVTAAMGAGDAEALSTEHVVRANVVMALVRLGRYEDARLVATALLQDEQTPLSTDLKVKLLFRRGLASKALGEDVAALADFKAAVHFSELPNVAAEREVSLLEKKLASK